MSPPVHVFPLVILSTVVSLCSGLSCYECENNLSNCPTHLTTGWSSAQVQAARCLIAYGDNRIALQQLSSFTQCNNPQTATDIKDRFGFSGVSIACCQDNLCNSNWLMAGGIATLTNGPKGGYWGGAGAVQVSYLALLVVVVVALCLS